MLRRDDQDAGVSARHGRHEWLPQHPLARRLANRNRSAAMASLYAKLVLRG
jgi:hypothetical protein